MQAWFCVCWDHHVIKIDFCECSVGFIEDAPAEVPAWWCRQVVFCESVDEMVDPHLQVQVGFLVAVCFKYSIFDQLLFFRFGKVRQVVGPWQLCVWV